MGTVANGELRAARKAAHKQFDNLCKEKLRLNPKLSKNKARNAGYRWLAGSLGISIPHCHIAQLTVKQCLKVIEICGPFNRKILDRQSERKQGRRN